jgi:hypothetical protein
MDITSFLVWRLAMRGFPGARIGLKPDILTFSPANHSSQTLAVADGLSLAVWFWPTVMPK